MTKFAKFAVVAVVALALVAGASSADAAFTRYLDLGSQGADVTELQTILEAQGYLVMPAGVAKGYFGALTKNAVMKWQAAVGLPSTGYFGPMSIAKIGMTGSTGGSTGSTGGSTSGSSNDLSGGDGDFKDFDVLGSPNNKDVDEGEMVEVFGFEFEADDSDLLVERVDVVASSTNSNVEKPWKVLEEIALVVDDEEVETIDASDEDNWDEVEGFDGEADAEAYRIRFEDLDWKVEEGETVKAYIAVTASDDIDTDETGEWEIGLDDDGIRARNAEGIDVYEGDDTDVKTFDIGEADEGELQITVDSNDNEDMEVEVSEDDTTDDVVVYTAEVESEEGTVNVEEVTITLATTSAVGIEGGLDEVIDTLYLFIDGEEVGSESVDGTATDAVVFDDIDVDLEENEEVEFEVRADINEQGDDEENFEDGVAFEVTDISIDFVDDQDDDQTAADSTDGGTITLNLNALSVDLASKSAAKYGSIDTQGEYYIRFTVTAPEEEDIYIPNGAASSSATNTGAFYKVLGTTNSQLGATASSTIATGSATSSLAELNLDEGGSDEGNGYYKVSSGNSATFELHVVLDNSNTTARGLKIQLAGVDYNTQASVAGMTRYTSGLDEDFRTSSVLLQAVDAD